jgi:hypothetical protein
LACGDGNGYFDRVQWSQWTQTYATATARQWVNDCKPNCANGHYTKRRVPLRLYAPTTLDFQRYFSKILVGGADGYREPLPRPRRGCATNAEYERVQNGDTQARVSHIFGTTGIGGASHRSYRYCRSGTGYAIYAEIWYENGRVVDKHWSDD